jgi:FMN-dependent NADH-azoreductase
MKLLQIDSSARAGSVTRGLTAKFAKEWKTNHPTGEVIQRDLSTTMLPLITDDWNATQIEPSKLSPAQRNYLSASDALIEEVQAADTIVIGAPMYNFAIPSCSRHGSIRLCESGRRSDTGQTAPRDCWEIIRSLSSLRAEAPMRKALPGKSSIFKNLICATFSALSVSRV